MKKTLMILLLANVLTYVIVIVAFYFIGFSMGLADNSSQLPQQERLFTKFVIFHFLFNFILLYRTRQISVLGVASSVLLVATLYIITAKCYDFF